MAGAASVRVPRRSVAGVVDGGLLRLPGLALLLPEELKLLFLISPDLLEQLLLGPTLELGERSPGWRRGRRSEGRRSRGRRSRGRRSRAGSRSRGARVGGRFRHLGGFEILALLLFNDNLDVGASAPNVLGQNLRGLASVLGRVAEARELVARTQIDENRRAPIDSVTRARVFHPRLSSESPVSTPRRSGLPPEGRVSSSFRRIGSVATKESGGMLAEPVESVVDPVWPRVPSLPHSLVPERGHESPKESESKQDRNDREPDHQGPPVVVGTRANADARADAAGDGGSSDDRGSKKGQPFNQLRLDGSGTLGLANQKSALQHVNRWC